MYWVVFLYCFIGCVSPSNILVWNPTIGHSHVKFLGNIADILSRDGHNVTVFSPIVDPGTKPFGTTEEDVHKISATSKYWNFDEIAQVGAKTPNIWLTPPVKGLTVSKNDWKIFDSAAYGICKGILDDSDLITRMQHSRFDVAILEVFDTCGVAMMELFGIKKTIIAAALGTTNYMHVATGLPLTPSFVPGHATTYGDDMTFWERLDNFKNVIFVKNANTETDREIQKIMNEYDPNFPDVVQILIGQTNAVFTNVNEFTESPRPMSNMVQYVAGATLYKPKPIEKELDDLLNSYKATVLFSLGTYSKSCDMSHAVKQAFLDAFATFEDIGFIWKYEQCSTDVIDFSVFKNVHRMEWIPQSDLLADPRVSSFITHAGMNSVVEAAFRGKPLITIPLFADQMMNSRNAVRRGLAIEIDKSSITKDLLVAAIGRILAPGSTFVSNATAVSAMLSGREEVARETIRHWTRLVVDHGPLEHLRMNSATIGFIQLYSLDVIAFIVAQFILIVSLPIVVLRYFCCSWK